MNPTASDALVLLGFVMVVMGITVVQERRTERALDALRDLSSPCAMAKAQMPRVHWHLRHSLFLSSPSFS